MSDITSQSRVPVTEPACSACGRTYSDIPLTAFPGGWGLPQRYYHADRRADWCSIHPHWDREVAIKQTWGWRLSPWSDKGNATQLDLSIEFLEATRPVYYETPTEAIVATLELTFDTDHVQALRDLITNTYLPLKDLWYPSVPWLPEGSTTALCVIGYEQQMVGVA
jgi:hypothetical protein